MSPVDPGEEETLEIIDQRRPTTHPAKYLAYGAVGLAFVVCSYLLLLHFTPREFISAATSPFEKSAVLTGRFLEHLGKIVTTSHVSTKTEIEVGRITPTDKLAPLIV